MIGELLCDLVRQDVGVGAEGAQDAAQRANKLFKRMLNDYEAPALDPAIDAGHRARDVFQRFLRLIIVTCPGCLAPPLRCAGVGFVSVLVTIAVCLSAILIITILFIPIYLILYAVAWYLAKIPVALWIGRTIFAKLDKPAGPYLALLAGLVVLYVIFAIPILGWVAWFVVSLLGLGAMITTYMAQREARKAAVAMPPAGGSPAQAPIAS